MWQTDVVNVSVSGEMISMLAWGDCFACSHNLMSVSSALQVNAGSGCLEHVPMMYQAVSTNSFLNAPAI